MNQRAIVVFSIALALCSCTRKAEGQTVAVVNGDEITASELNSELERAKLPPGLSRDEARSQVLQSLVERQLLVQQAKDEGIDKSPEFVTQERRLTQDLLLQMLISRQLKSSDLPSAQDIQVFEASHPGMFQKREFWTLNQLQYPAPNTAVAKQIEATKSLDEIAKVLKDNGIQFSPGTTQLDTATLPQEAYQQIQGAVAGEPFIINGGDRSVASVIASRKPAPRTESEARTFALSKIQQQKAQDLLKTRIANAKRTAEIKYQKGFGPPKS